MADIVKQSNYIAKKVVAEIKNKAVFINEIDATSYKNEFDAKVNGYKVGNTVYLAKTGIVKAIDGAVDGTDITGKFNEVEEELVTAKVNANPIVASKISDSDATFALGKPGEKAWSDRVIKPVVNAIVQKAEHIALLEYSYCADNAIIVDASGATYKDEFKKMNARLAANSAPDEDRIVIVNTDVQNLLSGEMEGTYFIPSADAKTAYAKAKIGSYAGMDFRTSEQVLSRVNGCGGNTITLAADYVGGASTMTITSGSGVVAGDVIEFNFNLVDQQSKTVKAKKVQRAIKAVAGNVITVSPLYFSDSVLQNVNADELLTGATATGLGTAGKTYLVCPVFQKMGFASASIKQPLLGGNKKINATTDMSGISFRIYSDDDINTGESKQRAESMAAYFAPRSEWCGRVEIEITLF